MFVRDPQEALVAVFFKMSSKERKQFKALAVSYNASSDPEVKASAKRDACNLAGKYVRGYKPQ